MTARGASRLLPFLLVASLLGAFPAAAAEVPSPAEKYFTNVELVDQDGKTVRLYDDLLADKIVVIDAIFTTCTGICPVMSKALERIQERVGDRLGKDVHLISISIDPTTDTPERLKEYAARWHAKPGWYFLTGKQDNVDLALRKLGQIFEEKESHNAIILVGNDRTGLWKKAYGLAAHEELLAIVESVLDDQG